MKTLRNIVSVALSNCLSGCLKLAEGK